MGLTLTFKVTVSFYGSAFAFVMPVEKMRTVS